MPRDSFVKTSQVYLMFTVSGATALVYQVIWSRWLGLVFGNTTTSVSIVLASFMLGLAVGSWAAGRALHHISNPMRAYALLELGIGIYAICFPFLAGITDTIFAATISVETSPAISMATRVILAFSLLLVPTSLMGATLPFLTDFFHRSPRHTRSWKVGLLYATNTLGAALGIVLAGFLLIELVGVSATTLIAAVMNMIVALIGFRLAPAGPLREPGSLVINKRTVDSRGVLAIGILTASGAVALASEVLWTRTLESLIGNSTYAFSLIVLLYLVGIALGSWLMSLVVNRLRDPALWLSSLQMGMGIWILISLFLFNGIVNGLTSYQGVMVSLSLLFWNYFKVMVLLLPLSLLSGACFPLATRIIDPRSEDAQGTLIARAYAWNTIGAVGGSLLAGFLIAPFCDYLDALYILASLYALTAAVAYGVLSRSSMQSLRQRSVMIAASGFAIILTVGAFGAAMLSNSFTDNFNKKYRGFEAVSHRMGLQGITTVIRERDQKTASRLLVNGMGMTNKVTDTKMMAHLPLFLHPSPQDTLVICFGMGTTYRSAVTHGGRVTVVELVKEVFDAFESFHEDARVVRDYPKGRMVVNDGRNFLRLTRDKYDVITIDPPPPIDAAGVNNLYSREFMELSKSRLKKGGIMAHWIPFPNTGSGVDDMSTFTMLFLTFADVFPNVYTQLGYEKIGLHVLGSMDPLDLSEKRIERLLKIEQVSADLQEWNPVTLSHFRVKRYNASFQSREKDLVTDDHPRLEFYLLRTWKQGGKKRFIANVW